MDPLVALREKLQSYKTDWPLIAEYSKVPLGTLIRVAQGYTADPRIGTVTGLAKGIEVYERKQERRA